MRIYFSSVGCKLNQAEIDHLERRFLAAGHPRVASLADADVHVVNTCTVTHLAARDSRKLARRASRLNPAVKTVITGCFVDGSPDEAADLVGVDLVIPRGDKDRLVERVLEEFLPATADREISSSMPVPYVPLAFGNSRALVKVEDGCNMSCSFCIIPKTRGRQRSRPLPEILAEVEGLSAGGYQEVVVTGVQISSYRWRDSGLYELTRALLEETRIPRLRLTSIAPWQFDRRLVSLFVSRRLCRHLHLSLQSGCTATLRRMRRPYSSEQFAELAGFLRREIPGLAITTDVIVGFPGESDVEFDANLSFARRTGFARLHAFPYSARPRTPAATMHEQVPHAVKRRRMERMLEVADQSRRRFEREHARRQAEVLWEYRRDHVWFGMTDNYLRVTTRSDDDLAHRITPVWLLDCGSDGMTCSLKDVGP